MGRFKVVFVGRLEEDTGVLEFLKWLEDKPDKFNVEFVGDGSLRRKCEEFGRIHGFVNPKPLFQKADICVPGGYLSYIEAKSFGCKIITFYNNPIKRDYWKEIKTVRKFLTWDKIADEYISLYNSKK